MNSILRTVVILVTLLAAVVPLPVLAAEPGNGKVEGQVVNETQGGAVVGGQEVVLKVFLNDAESSSKSGKTDASGRFVLEGLSTASNYSYQVTVNYKDADYTSDKVTFGKGETAKSVKVVVYDSTTTDEAVAMDSSHTIIYVTPGKLQIKGYSVVSNSSNVTWVGAREIEPGKRETLKFTLPPGATEPEYGLSLMGCCVVPRDGGFSDTMAVLPGTKEIVYAYDISYDGDVYTFSQDFPYPTSSYDLLIEGQGVSISSDKLAKQQPVTIEGKVFSRVSAADLKAGDTIKVELAGLPRTTPAWVRWAAIMLAVAALIAGLMFFTRRRAPARAAAGTATASSGTAALLRRKQKLLTEIARLDDQFEANEIEESVYRAQRTAKKKELLSVTEDLRKGGRKA